MTAPQDEAFWQQQEARISGALGQPCCTLSGMCSLLRSMPGRFAVVIHGERDCLNSFHLDQGPAVINFFTTGLSEREVTSGLTQEPLKNCLERVAAEHGPGPPQVVFVLGTCLVEMIGDRFERVVDEMSQKSGVPMVALHASGLKLGSQGEMLDWLFETLADLPPAETVAPGWFRRAGTLGFDLFIRQRQRDRNAAGELFKRCSGLESPRRAEPGRSLNFVGLPEGGGGGRMEPVVVLEGLGLEVNGIYPYGASLDDWRSIGHAGTSFVVDRQLYPRLIGRLESVGQRIVEIPLPVGLAQTDRFYRIVGEACGLGVKLDEYLREQGRKAKKQLDVFGQRRGKLRMAMGIRLLNNYRPDQLAYGGLGDVVALAEMGFDLTLLVQGPPEERSRKEFKSLLASRGCELPFEVFPDPWSLSGRLQAGRYDVAYLADHSREEAAKAGVPMIVSRGLAPFFSGISRNLATMDRLLDERIPHGESP
jgi:hypothetical protein